MDELAGANDKVKTLASQVVVRVHLGALLLTSVSVVAAAIILARFTGTSGYELFSVTLNISLAPAIFLCFTLGHVFLATFTVVAVTRFDRSATRDEARRLLAMIQRSEKPLLNGIAARRRLSKSRIVIMEWYDLTTWLFLGLAIIIAVAILPWVRTSTGFRWTAEPISLILQSVLISAILTINWLAGSCWTIAVTELSNSHSPNAYWLDDAWFFISIAAGPTDSKAAWAMWLLAIAATPLTIVLLLLLF